MPITDEPGGESAGLLCAPAGRAAGCARAGRDIGLGMNATSLLSDRALEMDSSGIRRVFELGASLRNPINLSIGQPDFPVPDALKRAATAAIDGDQNGYSLNQGLPALVERITAYLRHDVGWSCTPLKDDAGPTALVTAGTSGALVLAYMSLLGAGDEIIIPDPYFVSYPELATMCGARAVCCDTYPDFKMTAERVAPLITERTKAVLYCSPSNPAGVALTERECDELLDLCRSKGVLLIADEIYDEFAFADARTQAAAGSSGGEPRDLRCPSPARLPGSEDAVLLIRGFGKTYGCTGWRLGYCAGPPSIVGAMTKIQQYTFVCAPTPLQAGVLAAFDTDMGPTVQAYAQRRDMICETLGKITEVARPDGAFYAFVKIPDQLGLTGTQFFEKCVEQNLLVIPGGVFSERDTHIRLSYATDPARLAEGLEIIAGLMSR